MTCSFHTAAAHGWPHFFASFNRAPLLHCETMSINPYESPRVLEAESVNVPEPDADPSKRVLSMIGSIACIAASLFVTREAADDPYVTTAMLCASVSGLAAIGSKYGKMPSQINESGS